MPRRRKDNGRTATVSIYGFHADRGGTIWGYYKRREKSLELVADRRNWPEARRRLNAWIQRIENPPAIEVRKPTLFEAIESYDKAVMPDRPAQSRREFLQSIPTFYEHDMPLDFGTLQKHLAARVRSLKNGEVVSTLTKKPFAPLTIQQRAMRQQEFFRWCYQQRTEAVAGGEGVRWLSDSDPFVSIRLPEEPKQAEAQTYTDEQHERIMSRFMAWARYQRRRRPGLKLYTTDWYPLLWRWQRLTAMRIDETVSLRWAEIANVKTENHISDREILIMKSKNGKPRYIPLAAIPGLMDLVAELRAMPKLPDGAVFPWATICSPEERFRAFLENQGAAHRRALADPSSPAAGRAVIVQRGKTTIHVYRATAKALWALWGIPEPWRDYYAGHERSTSKRHYDVRPSYEEMMRDGSAKPGNGAPGGNPAAGYLPDIPGASRVIQGDFQRSG